MGQLEDAEKIERLFRENGIKAVIDRLPSGESRTHCLECDERIPEGRRLAMPGCEYCVTCQEEQSTIKR